MPEYRKNVEQLLRSWAGEDAGERTSPHELAAQIDREYQRYIASLPAATCAIVAGQVEVEKHRG